MSAHPHAENMRLYAEDAAVTDKPWERWECRWKGSQNDEKWSSFSLNPSWLDDAEYRRKPKPLECWILVTVSGHISECCDSLEEAQSSASRGYARPPRIVHMREVTE